LKLYTSIYISKNQSSIAKIDKVLGRVKHNIKGSNTVLELIDSGHPPYYPRTKPNSARCDEVYWKKLEVSH